MTRIQQETLQLIAGYIDQHNIAPSIRELADMRGLNTTSSISRILGELEVAGYIVRTKGHRGIQLTTDSEATKLAFRACRLLAKAETWEDCQAACAVAVDAIELRDTGSRS